MWSADSRDFHSKEVAASGSVLPLRQRTVAVSRGMLGARQGREGNVGDPLPAKDRFGDAGLQQPLHKLGRPERPVQGIGDRPGPGL
jgi:hypothetical protein